MYKINNKKLEEVKYDINKTNVDYFSEHLYFNNYFENLYIDKDWNFPSPIEYTFFNSYNLIEKMLYILKTLKNDIRNLYRM